MFLKLNQRRNRKKQNVSGEFLQKPKMHFFGGPKWYVLKVKFQICISAYDQLPIFVSIFLFNHSTLTGQWKRETNLVYRCIVFMYFCIVYVVMARHANITSLCYLLCSNNFSFIDQTWTHVCSLLSCNHITINILLIGYFLHSKNSVTMNCEFVSVTNFVTVTLLHGRFFYCEA